MFNHPFFYKKKLFKLLDLYGALVRDGKARTFQSAILMVRRQGEEPKSLKKIIAEVERELIAGGSLYESLKIAILYDLESHLHRYRNEEEFISQSVSDTWKYSKFVNKSHDWGQSTPEQLVLEEEFSAKLEEITERYEDDPDRMILEISKLDRPSAIEGGEIVESKICQLCIKILWRAKEEAAEEVYIDFSEADAVGVPVLMKIEGEKVQVFDLPLSLVFVNINVFLALADLPYWKKGEKKGRFELTAEDETYSGEVHLRPDAKELCIKLDQ